MAERLEPKESIIAQFQQVNDDTRAHAPQMALAHVKDCISGWQWHVDYFDRSIPEFGIRERKAVAKWQGFLDNLEGREPNQEEWDKVKGLLIAHGMQYSHSNEEYARGLLVLAASLP